MKTRLFSFLFALIAGVGMVRASDTEVNGIWYDFDDNAMTASVTFRGSTYASYTNEYTGDVTIPESVTYNSKTYSVTSVGNFAFMECSSLTSVNIPNSVTSIGQQAFSNCTSLTSIIVESGNTKYDSRDNCNAIIETSTNTLIAGCQNTIIPNSVTSIGEYAFRGCSNLISVTIPNSVTSIGEQAFAYCTSLSSVTIPNSVTSIEGHAFDGCNGLTSIDIPNSVTSIGQSAFSYCIRLTSITCQAASAPELGTNAFLEVDKSIPLYVPSGSIAAYQAASGWSEFTNIQAIPDAPQPEIVNPVQIGYFYYNLDADNLMAEVTYQEYESSNNYSGLTSANIPSSVSYSDKTFSVTSIGDAAFKYCSGLTSVTIPNSVTSIGSNAFAECSALTSIDIPNSVTSIHSYAFRACTNLSNVILPNNITNLGADDGIFSTCSSLTSINIPNSVTTIWRYTFMSCALTSVKIPNSVTLILSNAFSDCTDLTSITCEAVTPPTCQAASVFDGVDKSIPLYVPSGSIAVYQAASGWSEFTNIQAIPSSGDSPLFPGDPGTLTLDLQLIAAVIDGDSIAGQAPEGTGGYPAGTSVSITARDIPGYQFVQWSDSVTDQTRTVVLNESMILTALYSRSMIEIAVAANQWTFFCLPPLGDTQYTQDMFTYDGLNEVKWGTYNGEARAAGKSGWQTPEAFNALQGYIIYSTTAGTLRINAYQDEIRQGESADNGIYATIAEYSAPHPENAGWNFLGNPYAQGFDISAFADAGIEAPITVWNGTGYTTYTPGIDAYILKPFEAFFIQKAEGGAEAIPFNRE